MNYDGSSSGGDHKRDRCKACSNFNRNRLGCGHKLTHNNAGITDIWARCKTESTGISE